MQSCARLGRGIRSTLACTAATLIAASAFAAGAGAAEPLDDHGGGAAPFGPGSGAIDHPGDRDWYLVTLGRDDTDHTVFAARRGGSCEPDALRITVLNPEGRPIRWAVVAPGRWATLALPSFKPGDYFVEIDAAGQPDCADLAYDVGFLDKGGRPDAAGAKCTAARNEYSERVKARNDDRKWAKMGNARAKKNLPRWPKTLARYMNLAKKACRKKR